MYLNSDFHMRKSNGDERIIGKIDLRFGLIAAAVFCGLLGFIICVACQALFLGVLLVIAAASAIVLVVTDPTGWIRRHTRPDEPEDRFE